MVADATADVTDAEEGTFIRRARRSQLVAVAITTIADVGLERASMVQIAKRAGVSRGVLTHHFTGRDDVLDAVVREVYAVARDALAAKVAAAGDPRASLLTFVGGSIDFYAAYPDHMAALREIFAVDGRPGAPGRADADDHRGERDAVVALLRAGQERGLFRPSDVETSYAVIRAILDAGLVRVRAGADVDALRAELVETVDRTTRAAS
ncbi:TetR family transcriptional regulator [Patulibacter minatonensis]|uniref:TetR family transcriptional regulator n=1 Tax=Patulibacter minatonensis TaxID=298163 RepID=UPI000685AD6C|nr:TetR family transcriptional regulator [Patulibacter minatonensis]